METNSPTTTISSGFSSSGCSRNTTHHDQMTPILPSSFVASLQQPTFVTPTAVAAVDGPRAPANDALMQLLLNQIMQQQQKPSLTSPAANASPNTAQLLYQQLQHNQSLLFAQQQQQQLQHHQVSTPTTTSSAFQQPWMAGYTQPLQSPPSIHSIPTTSTSTSHFYPAIAPPPPPPPPVAATVPVASTPKYEPLTETLALTADGVARLTRPNYRRFLLAVIEAERQMLNEEAVATSYH